MLLRPTSRLAHATAIRWDRREILGFVVFAAIPVAAYSADLPSAGAVATVARLHNALLTGMKAGREVSFQRRFAILEPVVDQAFDLPAVLAVSVGSRWTDLAPDQQARLLQAFRRYTVASYVASFDNYAGQTFSVSPEIRAGGVDQVVVQTRIVPAEGTRSGSTT
jgi:phospholipid transport system substrate-binding protein